MRSQLNFENKGQPEDKWPDIKSSMKICKVCAFEGDISLFIKNRRICKICYSKIQAQYRAQANKEETATYQHKYRQINLEYIQDQKKQYYEANKDMILEQQRLYYLDNSGDIKIRNTEYRKNHKDARNIHEKQRRDTDPNYKLRVYLSRDIFRSVESKNGISTFNILPYSVIDLRKHLESQFEPWMNWDNHGRYDPNTWDDNNHTTWTWQIDHIIPRSKFSYTAINDSDFIKCWALNNLRPLSSKINLISGSKLEKRKR